MRLLYLTEDVPNRDPVHGDGSSMIPFELLRAFPREMRTTVLTFDTGVPVPAEVRELSDEVVLLQLREVASGPLRSLLRADDAATARSSAEARREVRRRSAAADVTLLHGAHVLPLASSVVGPLVVQSVDPWSAVMGMNADQLSGARRVYWRLRQQRARLSERRTPARARLLTVGAADAAAWSGELGRPVRAIANGVEHQPRLSRSDGPPTLCFLGSLDYPPNVDSAIRLVERVAPTVWQRFPDARVIVAGRLPVPEVLALAGPRVEVRPNVATAASVFADSDVAVFPDRFGLGVRNSVQEALAAGLPVVASPAAARELPAQPLLDVQDSDDDLAAAVMRRLQRRDHQPDEASSSSVRTWTQAANDYHQELIAAGRV